METPEPTARLGRPVTTQIPDDGPPNCPECLHPMNPDGTTRRARRWRCPVCRPKRKEAQK